MLIFQSVNAQLNANMIKKGIFVIFSSRMPEPGRHTEGRSSVWCSVTAPRLIFHAGGIEPKVLLSRQSPPTRTQALDNRIGIKP